MASILQVLLALGAAGSEPQDGQMPEALREAFYRRMALSTAHVKYRIVTELRGRTWKWEENRDDWYSEEDFVTVNFGDRDGLRLKSVRGEPLIGVSEANGPEKHLYSRSHGEYWKYREGSYEAAQERLTAHRIARRDARVLGLSATWTLNRSPLREYESWNALLMDYYWRQEHDENGMIIVNAKRRNPDSAGKVRNCEWFIDPGRNYAVPSVTCTDIDMNGKKELVAKSETEYDIVNDMWFPVRFFSDDRSRHEKTWVTITHAEFNRPEHPKSLSPADLGMPIGVAVHNWERGQGVGPGFTMRWDGTRLLEWDEWERVKHQYDTSGLEEIRRRWAKYGPPGAYPAWWWEPIDTVGVKDVAIMPDEWETYVRRWILRHTVDIQDPLDESQKTAAWAILKDCRRRAVSVVEAFKEQEKRLTQLEKAAARAEHATPRVDPSAARAEPSTPQAEQSKTGSEKPATGAAKTSGQSAAVPTTSAPADELSRHRRTMERRLASIFEELKQRLDKLRRANQVPSTQPGRLVPPPPARKGSR